MIRILVLNFFPAFTPPSSGGELRYFNLYKKLSAFFDITLLSPTYPNHSCEVVEHSPSFREYRVPKETVHELLHQQIDLEQIGLEVSALVCALSSNYPNSYHKHYLELYASCDLIIHESPYLIDYDLFFGFDDKVRIYNSYNIESLLVQQMWKGENATKYIQYIRYLEERMATQADLCLAVSEEEKASFHQYLKVPIDRIALAPNGIDPGEYAQIQRKPLKSNRISALFIGSYHPPNISAGQFITDYLADACPDIDFWVAGDCCRALEAADKKNLRLFGKISSSKKNELLSSADIAINPMFAGAGTNFKVLEYLSAGIPLVSTAFGARGLHLNPDEHFILAEKENFADILHKVSRNGDMQCRVSELGRRFVNQNYSWNSIASSVAERISNVFNSRRKNKKKKIFLLNDFGVSAPCSGGEVRINSIYNELSRNYKIALLALNSSGLVSRTELNRSFLEISLPKTNSHLEYEQIINSKHFVRSDDIVTSMCVHENELVSLTSKILHELCDVVILCHPFMVNVLHQVERKPVIYESLNCETDLKRDTLRGHPDYLELIKAVETCERKAIERSRLIISVSDLDHEGLQRLANDRKNIYTVPNGVKLERSQYSKEALRKVKKLFGGHPVIVFVGSGHKPNLDSVSVILKELAPSMPDCYFLIIGEACDAFNSNKMHNTILCGKVDLATKEILMKVSDLAINPMLSGSGSNLKIADYFANKLPTVTTPYGARGYKISNGEHAIICELPEFRKQIYSLLSDAKLRHRLAENGYNYVKLQLTWDCLADQFDEILRKEIFAPGRKRVLIVTHRFTEPPLGGAEAHLLELVRHLDESGQFLVDVVTFNIARISNRFHFSCEYGMINNQFCSEQLGNTRVHAFELTQLPEETVFKNAVSLLRLWNEESRKLSLWHKESYEFPILMGGWNYPEHTEGRTERWTTDNALVYIKNLESIRIRGICPEQLEVSFIADDRILCNKVIEGSFNIDLILGDYKILNIKPKAVLRAPGDPRILGIKVQAIEGVYNSQSFSIPLDYDFRNFLRKHYPDEYINDLIKIALSRPIEFDAIFQSTRGPVSEDLKNWLANNIRKYDIVIGHSMPFSTPIMAVEYAKKSNKPVILIPDFHIDDEFYHWRSYYAALKEADILLTFPQTAAKLFYDKIGANSRYLPVGIHLDERAEEEDILAFRKLYNSNLPFVLLLGRKDRAKNYDQVIQAVQKLNATKKTLNLVFIGRDEDGVTIKRNDAIYLGGQPRGIVLAAIAQSVCLVAMSESESFGIIILESWAQKRPVIVNENCFAYRELVEDEVTGLYANRDNLAEKILYLMQHPEKTELMGTNGYQKLRKHFSWDKIATEFIRTIHELCPPGEKP